MTARGPRGHTGVSGPTGDKAESGEILPWKVRRAFWTVVIVSALVLTALGFVIKDNRALAKEGAEAHDALCLLRANLERRNAATEDFLKNNDDQIIIGVPRRTIVARLNQDKATVKSMEFLDCVPPPEPTKEASISVP